MIGAATMELDELKTAWQRLDRQLQQQNQINLHMLRDKKMDKTRKSLRPLFWGHTTQILLGVISIIFGVAVWSKNMDSTPLLTSGLIAHIYGIILIITAAQIMQRIKKLDYSAPVIEIQKQLLGIERAYVNAGWLVGLPWWLLWIPYSLGFAGLAGIDLYAQASSSGWLIWSVATGILGMLLTWLWYRWAQHPGRAERATRIKQAMAGTSLKNARQLLAEIEQFEQDQ